MSARIVTQHVPAAHGTHASLKSASVTLPVTLLMSHIYPSRHCPPVSVPSPPGGSEHTALFAGGTVVGFGVISAPAW